MNEFNKFDKWNALRELLYIKEDDLAIYKERHSNTEDEYTKSLYQELILRREHEIEGLKKWLEEYR
ncbi:hypothetical protein NSR02_07000 [Bacillus sp. FSL W8-1122]